MLFSPIFIIRTTIRPTFDEIFVFVPKSTIILISIITIGSVDPESRHSRLGPSNFNALKKIQKLKKKCS